MFSLSEQIDTFQSILALYTTFLQCHASHKFFAQSYIVLTRIKVISKQSFSRQFDV